MTAEGQPRADEAAEFGLRPALIGVAASAAALTAFAFALFDARLGAGVALGGTIATANLWVMARVARAFIAQKGRAAPWAIVAGIKLVALILGIWLVLRTGAISPVALVIGYGSLPLGITLGSLFGPKPPDDFQPQDGPSREGPTPPGDVVEGGPPSGEA